MNRQILHRISIQADANGDAPSSIQLLNAGTWKTPWHGEFDITPADLSQFVENFNGGVGLVEGSKKAPINYGHDISGKASGWITRLFVDDTGTQLWGDIEWTPKGRQMLADGEFRYISPEFNPRDLPWEDPEQEFRFVNNVLTGAGLTNIPLFKKLKPIMASEVTGEGDKSKPQGESMDLEKLRVKNADELTAEEKTFLEEHKADLTADERKTFDIQTDEDKAAEEQAAADAKAKEEADAKAAEDATKVEASRKGNVSISADRLAQLEADAKQGVEASRKLARTEAESFISASVAKGQIKSDQKDAAVELLLASAGDARKGLEAFIAGLPENKIITAGELGHGGTGSTSATDELFTKANDIVKASDGKTTLAEATKQVMASDADFAKRVEAERAGE